MNCRFFQKIFYGYELSSEEIELQEGHYPPGDALPPPPQDNIRAFHANHGNSPPLIKEIVMFKAIAQLWAMVAAAIAGTNHLVSAYSVLCKEAENMAVQFSLEQQIENASVLAQLKADAAKLTASL